MKKLHTFSAIVNLAMLAIWTVNFIVAKASGMEFFANTFVFVTIAAIIIPVIYTISSIIMLIFKSPLNKKLLAATYAVNFVWLIVVIYMIKTVTVMGSPLF